MTVLNSRFLSNGIELTDPTDNNFVQFAWLKSFKFGEHFKAEIKAAVNKGCTLQEAKNLLADLVECFLNSEKGNK